MEERDKFVDLALKRRLRIWVDLIAHELAAGEERLKIVGRALRMDEDERNWIIEEKRATSEEDICTLSLHSLNLIFYLCKLRV